DEKIAFDVRRVARALDDETRRREIVDVVLSPDRLAGEAVEFGQETRHVIEVEIPALNGRRARGAGHRSHLRPVVGRGLLDALDPELTDVPFIDRPALETSGVEID